MDIAALACLAFILVNIQYPRRGSGIADDALSMERTKALRGFAALLIILGHTALTVGECLSYPVLRQIGLFTVTVFFALSGYGLTLSYKKRGLAGFWKKRLGTVVLPYAVFTLLYVIVRLLLGESVSAKSVLLSFVNGTPTVKYSWFVEVILVCYAAFWVSGKLARGDMALAIFLVTAFTLPFCLAMKKLGFESYWYNTALCFPLGMLWAQYERHIADALRRHYTVYMIGMLTVFALVFYCTRVLWWWGELGEMLVTALFAALVLTLQYALPARADAVTRFVGDISFELYLSHGVFVMVLWQVPFFKEHPLVFALAVYAGATVTAWLTHMLLKRK